MGQNIYDDVLAGKPAGPAPAPAAADAPNEYDQVLQQQQSGRELAVRASLTQAAGTPPDAAAETRRLALKFGVPPAVVDRNLDTFKQREVVDQAPLPDLTKQTPKLAGWIADPNNAAVAHDDLAQLGFLEWVVSAWPRAIAQTINQGKYSGLRYKEILGETLTQQEHDELAAAKYQSTIDGDFGAGDSWFKQSITGAGQLVGQMFQPAIYGAAGYGAGFVVGGVVSGLASGGTAALPGALATASVTGRAAGLYGMLKSTAQQESTQMYDELLDMKDEHGQPVDPQVARVSALVVGALNAGIEIGEIKVALDSFPALKKLKGESLRFVMRNALRSPTIRAAFGQLAKEYGGTLVAEAAQEVAQRAVALSGEELAKYAGQVGNVPGQQEVGNIDLFKQPKVANPDGTTSTVDSLSVNLDGKEVLLPTVTPDGRHFTGPDAADQAIAEYQKTGRHLGIFESPAAATAFAEGLHNDYAAGKYDAASKFRSPGEWFNQLLQEGEGALTSFALGVGLGPALNFAGNVNRARAAERNVAIFNALAEGTKQSKTAERAPAAAQAFIAEATKDGPLETVYAPIDTWSQYWQSKGLDPVAVATEITGDPNAYQQAADSGHDLPIPTAAYALKLAGTEHHGYFANELRLDPEGMNGREAEQFKADLEAARAEGTYPGTGTEPTAPSSSDQVRQLVYDRLVAAGTPADTAQTYAAAWQAGIGSMADRAGLDLAGPLLARYGPGGGPTISRPELAPAAPSKAPAAAPAPVEQSGAGPAAIATFLAHGPMGPLYNIVGGPADKSTVTAGRLADLGIAVPETPAFTGERLTGDQIRAKALAAKNAPADEAGRSLGGYAGPERRAGGGQGPDNIERRAPQTTAEIAAAMRRDNPNIDREAAAMRARAQATPRLSDPELQATVDAADVKIRAAEDSAPGRTPTVVASKDANAETSAASGPGPGSENRAAQRADVGASRVDEGAGAGAGTERGGLPASRIPELDEVFVRQPADVNAARLTPEITREIDRIVDELEEWPYVARTWNWIEGPKTGNAAGGAADIVAGQAGAPVYDDVLLFSPVNKVTVGKKKGEAAKLARGSRGDILKAGRAVLAKNDIPSNLAEGIVRVAERRAAGQWKDLSPSWLPPKWGTPVDQAFTDALAKDLDDAIDQGGDASFDPTTFDQSLFDALKPAPAAADTLSTGEVQPRLPGDVGAVQDQNVPTPQLEAPFSLTSEASKANKEKQTTLFQPVYHGTPHTFEAFSLQAIGTGEGAQAYGWGLYFASNREVAEYYRSHVVDMARINAINEKLSALATQIGTHTAVYRQFRPGDLEGPRLAAEYDRLMEERDNPPKGRLFTVEIPEDPDFLDWDKPASQQSPKVQAALKALGVTWETFTPKSPAMFLRWFEGKEAQQLWREDIGMREALGQAYHYAITGDIDALNIWQELHQGFFPKGMIDPTGELIYRDLGFAARETAPHLDLREGAKFASLQLNQQGVAGIRYLDGVSRAKGGGSSNYVVFDEKLAQITQFDQPLFHGSPHDFERFSLEHIGTGEGAAAYGWGLYFAENPAVAADYHDRLSEGRDVVKMKLGTLSFKAPSFNYSTKAHVNAVENMRASLAESLLANPLDLNAAGEAGFQAHVLQTLDDTYDFANWPEGKAAYDQLRAELSKPGAVKVEFTKTTGGIYQVDIPDEHLEKMIDWDAPIKEQPAAVQAVVRDYLKDAGYLRAADNGPRQLTAAFKAYTLERGGMANRDSGEMVYFLAVDRAALRLAKAAGLTGRPGPEGLKAIAQMKQDPEIEKRASLELAADGIPGLRYLDQGSRDQGKGTRNVVVFDDSIVTLTHKDGTPFTPAERKQFFQGDEPERRGNIQFGRDRQFNINLFANADLSTFLHETGHFFLEVMGDLVDRINELPIEALSASQKQMLADYGALLQHAGVENRADLKEAQHETIARSFEAYLMEGKAPSLELRNAFSRFRAWLLGVYKSLSNLNVSLTPEVRGVFDRLLASDREIAEAEQEGRVAPMFLTAAMAGMSESTFSLYRASIADASRAAREQLDVKLLADVQREQTAAWKAQRADVRASIEADVHARPVFQALAAIQRGTRPDGGPLVDGLETAPLKLSKQIIVDRFGADRLKSLPKPYVYTVDGGIDPDLVASMFGYSSGDALLTAIAGAGSMRQTIERETDARMLAEHGSLLLDGSLHAEAQAAVANEDRDRVIRAELRALGQLRRTVAPFVKAGNEQLAAAQKERAYERRWFDAEAKLKLAIQKGQSDAEIAALEDEVSNLRRKARGGAATINAAIPPAGLLKENAQRRIAATKIRDLKPALFWSAAVRASNLATDHAARQDFDGAIVAKQQQLINLALYREAVRVVDDIKARVTAAAALATPKTQQRIGLTGSTYLEQINGVLDRYEFAQIPRKELEKRARVKDWVEALEAQGLPVDDIPQELLDDARRVNYKDITVDELVGITDGLHWILHLVKLKGKLLKAADEREFSAVRDGLVNSARKYGKQRTTPLEFRAGDETKRAIGDWFASHMKLSMLVRALDGHIDGGAWWEAIMRPINAAADAEAVRKIEEGAKFSAIINRHYPRGADLSALSTKLEIPAIGDSLSKEGRLAVALNWGNQTSRDRLLADPRRKWTLQQINAILDTLDARDWQFVQDTFDYINTFWPEIAAKQERVTGIAPDKVEALPIDTKFGRIAGGYYPLAYDSRLNARAAQNEAASAAKLATSAAYVRTTTRRGHTVARLSNVRLSVRLDLGVVFGHLEQVIHDLTHHEMLIDVNRLLRDRQVQEAIYDTKGDHVYKQFTRGVQDIAVGTAPATNVLEKSANFMRTGTQIAMLGWNVWTALQQPFGLFNGAQRVGPQWVARGMKRWLRDAASMENTAAWIADVSPMMRERSMNATQDLSDLRQSLGQAGGWFDQLVRKLSLDHVTQQGVLESFLWHIGLAQRVADIPTWLGGYEKAMAAGNDEARAIALADQGVLDSQGGGSVKDLALVQRGGPIARAFMMFYSYGNTVFNSIADVAGAADFKSATSIGTFLGHLSLLLVMPAFATVSMGRLTGRSGGKDDDGKSFLMDWGREILATSLNLMVGVRELGGLAAEGSRGYSGPAGTRIIQTIYDLRTQVQQGKADAAFWKAINATAGILFRYPALQVQRTVEGATALSEGRTHNPLALLVGAPKKVNP